MDNIQDQDQDLRTQSIMVEYTLAHIIELDQDLLTVYSIADRLEEYTTVHIIEQDQALTML